MFIEILISVFFNVLSFLFGVFCAERKYKAQLKKNFTDIFLSRIDESECSNKSYRLVFCEETEKLFLLIRLCAMNQSQTDGAIHNPKLFYSGSYISPISNVEIYHLSAKTKTMIETFFNSTEYFEKDFSIPKEQRRHIGLMFSLDNYLPFSSLSTIPMKLSYEQFHNRTIERELLFSVDLFNFSNQSEFEAFRTFQERQKTNDKQLGKSCEKKIESLFR